jgi:hypothetical protein
LGGGAKFDFDSMWWELIDRNLYTYTYTRSHPNANRCRMPIRGLQISRCRRNKRHSFKISSLRWRFIPSRWGIGVEQSIGKRSSYAFK